jgi:hypothetical protein
VASRALYGVVAQKTELADEKPVTRPRLSVYSVQTKICATAQNAVSGTDNRHFAADTNRGVE